MNRNRKFKQLYGRLDMVDLDRHEKYYGSLGLADPFTIETKQGNPLLLDGTKERPFEGMRIFGKSTQDGTPSPENPVPIVSAGDEGEINVSVSDGGTQSQTLTLSTPNGLPGIPVDSGGNYTDADGQQWVCDEVDFERGVYVQRINKKIPDRRNVMSQAEFIGMMILCGSVLIGLFAAIYSPLTKNTQTMTRLTLTMEQLIKRMDDQEGSLKEHVRDFEAYKEHVKDSQRRQWDEIDKHHDELVKHEHDIKTIKDSIKAQEEREC